MSRLTPILLAFLGASGAQALLAQGDAAITAMKAQREPALLCTGYAVAGISDAKQIHSAFLEWRGRPFWLGLAPYAFGSLRETGASYIGIGLVYGIDLTSRCRLSLASGPGYFEHDGDFDLGSRLEFASTIEIACRLTRGYRIACGLGHVSNAGVERKNPGSEFVRFSLQLPFPIP